MVHKSSGFSLFFPPRAIPQNITLEYHCFLTKSVCRDFFSFVILICIQFCCIPYIPCWTSTTKSTPTPLGGPRDPRPARRRTLVGSPKPPTIRPSSQSRTRVSLADFRGRVSWRILERERERDIIYTRHPFLQYLYTYLLDKIPFSLDPPPPSRTNFQ